MKIGIVTTWFDRGAAYVSKQYADALKDGHEIFIYARGGEYYAKGNEEWENNYNVTWAKKSIIPVNMAIDKNDFLAWLKSNHIEIVFFNEQQWWIPILWCLEQGVIIGSYIDYYTEATLPLFNVFDFLICNTKRHSQLFSWHSQCFYIPWGTDLKLFSFSNNKSIKNDEVVFFHSAGMSPYRKGTDLVLEAFKRVKGSAKLVIHSQVDISKSMPDMKNIVDEMLCSKRLQIYEKTVSAPGMYYMGDIYVYPSRLDGIGLTIAEALASGLPVITSNSPPMNEFIDEHNGRLVEISKYWARADGYYWPQCQVSIDSLVCEMQYYVDHRDAIHEYRYHARQYAEKYLNWAINSQSLPYVFNHIKKLPLNKKTIAIEKLRIYEQSKVDFKLRIVVAFPWIFEFLGLIKKVMKRCH